jgi:hypothetical protein
MTKTIPINDRIKNYEMRQNETDMEHNQIETNRYVCHCFQFFWLKQFLRFGFLLKGTTIPIKLSGQGFKIYTMFLFSRPIYSDVKDRDMDPKETEAGKRLEILPEKNPDFIPLQRDT